MALTFHPSALFPEPYLSPWAADHSADVTNMVDAIHPGETTSPHLPLVEAATARAASLGGSLTEAEVIAALREAGAPEEWIAPLVAISWCESRHSPYSVGDRNGDDWNSLGQYQLWRGWFPAAGFTVDDAFDPLVNARVAVYVRTVRGQFGGAGGWSCATLNGIP